VKIGSLTVIVDSGAHMNFYPHFLYYVLIDLDEIWYRRSERDAV
jgi:hypothetical protein